MRDRLKEQELRGPVDAELQAALESTASTVDLSELNGAVRRTLLVGN